MRLKSGRGGTKLGRALKAAREALDLSRPETARRADIDAAMLFRIENAPNANPTFETVARLSIVLGLDLNHLARG